MPSALGGFAEGYLASRQLRAAEAQQRAQNEAAQQESIAKQYTEAKKQFDDTFNILDQGAKNLIAKSVDPNTDPSFQKSTEMAVNSISNTISLWNARYPDNPIDPTPYGLRYQNLINKPNLQQQQANKAAETLATEQAKLGAKGIDVTNPAEMALVKANYLSPKVSEAMLHIQERKGLATSFGEGSAEVRRFDKETEKQYAPDWQNFIFKDGTNELLDTMDHDAMVDASARGAMKASTVMQPRNPAEAFVTAADASNQRIEFANQEAAIQSFIDSGNNEITRVLRNPAILTAGGDVAQFADNLSAHVSGLVNVLFPDTKSDALDIRNYDADLKILTGKMFSDVAALTAAHESVVFNAALQWAAASGLGKGRELSNQEIKAALRIMGEGVASSRQFAAKLSQSQTLLADGFATRVRVMNERIGGLNYGFTGFQNLNRNLEQTATTMTPEMREELERLQRTNTRGGAQAAP